MWLFRALLFVPLLLTACGFQLRGSTDFPPGMSAVYIDAPDRFSPFYRELTKTLRETELTLSNNPIDADTVIRVLNDETGRRALSVSARNVPREYEVFYLVRFSVFIADEEVLTPQQFIQEEVLRESLAVDLVGLLVQRLGAIN
jgi:LPS-assembly lipoprotein